MSNLDLEDSWSEEEEEPASSGSSRYNLRSRPATVENSSHALRTLLSVLMGERGSSSSYREPSTDSEDTDDDDFENEVRNRGRNARSKSSKRVRPDGELVKRLDESDFSLMTQMQLQPEVKCSKTSNEKFPLCKKPRQSPSSSDLDSPSKSQTNQFHFVTLNEDALRNVIKTGPMPSLIAHRELGDFRKWRNFGDSLSFGQRCQVLGTMLPTCRKVLASFRQKLFCGSYSREGDLFMSACQDQNIRIYSTKYGKFKLMKTIRARNVGWSIIDVQMSPDRQHLIYSSWCDYIHQVNVFGDEERHIALPLTPEDGRLCLFSLRFSQDGFEILGGANDGYLYLFDRIGHTESLKINAHDDDVNAVAFTDSSTHVLASGGDDGVCKIWDRRALRENNPVPVGLFVGHVNGITYIDPRGDGRHLITNSKDQSIKLWDVRRFSPPDAILESRRAVGSQNWDYRWQGVPKNLGRKDRCRSLKSDTSVMTYRGHTVLQTLIRCHFSPLHSTGQRFIYTGCASGAVIIYDVLTGQIVSENRGHRACVRDVSWHPYDPEMVSSSWDFKLVKWNYQPESVQEELKAEKASKKKTESENPAYAGKTRKMNSVGMFLRNLPGMTRASVRLLDDEDDDDDDDDNDQE